MMNDTAGIRLPPQYQEIHDDSMASSFNMLSDIQTGNLLRTLATTYPEGKFLELGTGTGLGTCWLLEGMDPDSKLMTMDNSEKFLATARKHLGHDKRVIFHCEDGVRFLERLQGKETFDLVYADTWPGKYDRFDLCRNLVKRGGTILFDDMLPQPNWPEDHPPKVERLLKEIDELTDFHVTKMCWSTGIILLTKI